MIRVILCFFCFSSKNNPIWIICGPKLKSCIVESSSALIFQGRNSTSPCSALLSHMGGLVHCRRRDRQTQIFSQVSSPHNILCQIYVEISKSKSKNASASRPLSSQYHSGLGPSTWKRTKYISTSLLDGSLLVPLATAFNITSFDRWPFNVCEPTLVLK